MLIRPCDRYANHGRRLDFAAKGKFFRCGNHDSPNWTGEPTVRKLRIIRHDATAAAYTRQHWRISCFDIVNNKEGFMRIRGTGPIQTPGSAPSTASTSANGSFRSLLQQRLSALREDGAIPPQGEQPESWGMIEDAALLLDEALSRLQEGGAPEPELVQNLRELRKQLRRRMPEGSEGLADLDTLIAVETHRLERW